MTFSASSTSASDDSLALNSVDEEKEMTPKEDRERIIQLGIAITWIMQERVSDITHAQTMSEFTINL